MALTRYAHQRVREHATQPDAQKELAIDATCGNGHDTEFLARLGFTTVIGFDIQQTAIDITRRRIDAAGLGNVKLVRQSHAELERHIDNTIDCLMFNLGYLPHGDKSITTEQSSSLVALRAGMTQLSDGGLISIMCYPGHPEGATETHAIAKLITGLGDGWLVETIHSDRANPAAPLLHLILKTNTND